MARPSRAALLLAAAAAVLLCCHQAAGMRHPQDDSLAPDADAAAALAAVVADAMRSVGWPHGLQFAAFNGAASLHTVLLEPGSYAGALLLIVPGDGKLQRCVPSVISCVSHFAPQTKAPTTSLPAAQPA